MKNVIHESQLGFSFDSPASGSGISCPSKIDEITDRFIAVFRFYQNRSKKKISPGRLDVSFYSYRTLKHTLRYRENTVQVKISHFAGNQPSEYYDLLAHCLWSDLFRMKCPEEYRRRFDEIENRLERRIRGSGLYLAQRKNIDGKGSVYNLDRMLKNIIREYRFGLKSGLTIGWSRNQARRRLGYYDVHAKTIIISRILDHSEVPAYVVEYIVYHELLHHIIPFENSGSNKKYHGTFFKRNEKRFRNYTCAEQWLKNEYPEWVKRTFRTDKKKKMIPKN